MIGIGGVFAGGQLVLIHNFLGGTAVGAISVTRVCFTNESITKLKVTDESITRLTVTSEQILEGC